MHRVSKFIALNFSKDDQASLNDLFERYRNNLLKTPCDRPTRYFLTESLDGFHTIVLKPCEPTSKNRITFWYGTIVPALLWEPSGTLTDSKRHFLERKVSQYYDDLKACAVKTAERVVRMSKMKAQIAASKTEKEKASLLESDTLPIEVKEEELFFMKMCLLMQRVIEEVITLSNVTAEDKYKQSLTIVEQNAIKYIKEIYERLLLQDLLHPLSDKATMEQKERQEEKEETKIMTRFGHCSIREMLCLANQLCDFEIITLNDYQHTVEILNRVFYSDMKNWFQKTASTLKAWSERIEVNNYASYAAPVEESGESSPRYEFEVGIVDCLTMLNQPLSQVIRNRTVISCIDDKIIKNFIHEISFILWELSRKILNSIVDCYDTVLEKRVIRRLLLCLEQVFPLLSSSWSGFISKRKSVGKAFNDENVSSSTESTEHFQRKMFSHISPPPSSPSGRKSVNVGANALLVATRKLSFALGRRILHTHKHSTNDVSFPISDSEVSTSSFIPLFSADVDVQLSPHLPSMVFDAVVVYLTACCEMHLRDSLKRNRTKNKGLTQIASASLLFERKTKANEKFISSLSNLISDKTKLVDRDKMCSINTVLENINNIFSPESLYTDVFEDTNGVTSKGKSEETNSKKDSEVLSRSDSFDDGIPSISAFTFSNAVCAKLNSIAILRIKLEELLNVLDIPQSLDDVSSLKLFKRLLNEIHRFVDVCFALACSIPSFFLFFNLRITLARLSSLTKEANAKIKSEMDSEQNTLVNEFIEYVEHSREVAFEHILPEIFQETKTASLKALKNVIDESDVDTNVKRILQKRFTEILFRSN